MGNHLTDPQIQIVREELSLLYSLPYAVDLAGDVWEQVLAHAKGGKWTGKRDNRARPDVTLGDGEDAVRYSVKTEALKATRERARAVDFLGLDEDLIIARPKVDELLTDPQEMATLSPSALGSLVLRFYNERIVQRHKWDVLSILLRVGSTEFIYWEVLPVPVYDPVEYWWQESGRATGTNRNINGYPLSVATGGTLPRAKFKWTSGGKQFYVLYEIPITADVFSITKMDLTRDEVKAALHSKLAEKLRASGVSLPT